MTSRANSARCRSVRRPSTVTKIVAPAIAALGSCHPQLTVTCLVNDQAQLRELALRTVDVVLGQRYHHLPDATPQGAVVAALRTAAQEGQTACLPPARGNACDQPERLPSMPAPY